MESEIVLVVHEGRNYVGKMTNGNKDKVLEDVHEVLLMVGQEMQMVPIKLGDMREVPSTALIIVLDRKSSYYDTYIQSESGLSLPHQGGPRPVGRQ